LPLDHDARNCDRDRRRRRSSEQRAKLVPVIIVLTIGVLFFPLSLSLLLSSFVLLLLLSDMKALALAHRMPVYVSVYPFVVLVVLSASSETSGNLSSTELPRRSLSLIILASSKLPLIGIERDCRRARRKASVVVVSSCGCSIGAWTSSKASSRLLIDKFQFVNSFNVN